MKVGILIHRFPPVIGGSEKYSEILANNLVERGHDVTVFTTYESDRSSKNLKYDVVEFKYNIPKNIGYYAWPGVFSNKVRTKLSSQDIIHAICASKFPAVLGAILKKTSGIPAVLTTFYHPPWSHPNTMLAKFYDRTILKHVLPIYNSLIVSSDYELSIIKDQFQISNSKVTRIDNPPVVDSDPATDEILNEYDIKGTFNLLYVGRLDAHKGITSLLNTVDQLREVYTDFQCIVVGEKERWYEWSDNISELVKRNRDHLIFTGSEEGERLAGLYSLSDLLILPSEYESYGFVTVEALNYDTPVVARPVGGAPELINNGENGYLYNPADENDLLEKITTVIEEGVSHDPVSASVDHLNWESTIDQVIKLYRNSMAD